MVCKVWWGDTDFSRLRQVEAVCTVACGWAAISAQQRTCWQMQFMLQPGRLSLQCTPYQAAVCLSHISSVEGQRHVCASLQVIAPEAACRQCCGMMVKRHDGRAFLNDLGAACALPELLTMSSARHCGTCMKACQHARRRAAPLRLCRACMAPSVLVVSALAIPLAERAWRTARASIFGCRGCSTWSPQTEWPHVSASTAVLVSTAGVAGRRAGAPARTARAGALLAAAGASCDMPASFPAHGAVPAAPAVETGTAVDAETRGYAVCGDQVDEGQLQAAIRARLRLHRVALAAAAAPARARPAPGSAAGGNCAVGAG